MTAAVFPGSFDPPTNGHLDIIARSSRLFDKVDVVIASNESKRYLFTQDERLSMMREIARPFANVSVHVCSGLIVGYAKKTGANVLLRGIRNVNDFSYEFDLALMNHKLDGEIETLFVPTDQKNMIIKSSAIKELAQLGGDVSGMVPPVARDALLRKFGASRAQ